MSTDDRTTREHKPTNKVVRAAINMPALLLSLYTSPHTHGSHHTNGGLGPTRAQETCLAVCTETRLAHHKPERTGKAIFGDRQELPQAGSSVESARRDVGALEDVVSCDAR